MSPKPITIFLAALSAAALTGVAASASAHTAHGVKLAAATAGAKVQVRHTSLGNVLVNGRGFTLYAFSRDGRNHDRCMSISGCHGVWPLDRTHGRPVAGRGVHRSMLGTIHLAGVVTQVTYAGHPLYTYSGDSSAGQTYYVGASQFGGTWRAIRASGHLAG
jgi:predicted lipoprotein with Yx(FWY)xxD motif